MTEATMRRLLVDLLLAQHAIERTLLGQGSSGSDYASARAALLRVLQTAREARLDPEPDPAAVTPERRRD